MRIEVICTGDEVLTGKIVNTNFSYMTQKLEDVACLVFLDDQFDKFERELGDEEKMVDILRKTWGKMSEKGREEALKIELSERGKLLVERALQA